jgi:sugar phosphate permease
MWLAGSDVQVLRSTMWVPGVLAWLVALWCCARSSHRPWRVVRGEALPA